MGEKRPRLEKRSLLKLQTSHRQVTYDYTRLQTSHDESRRVQTIRDESQTSHRRIQTGHTRLQRSTGESQTITDESPRKFFWIHLQNTIFRNEINTLFSKCSYGKVVFT